MDPFTASALIGVALAVVDQIVLAIYKTVEGQRQQEIISKFRNAVKKDRKLQMQIVEAAASRDAQLLSTLMNSTVGGALYDAINWERVFSNDLSKRADKFLEHVASKNEANADHLESLSVNNAYTTIQAAQLTADFNKAENKAQLLQSDKYSNQVFEVVDFKGKKHQVTGKQLGMYLLRDKPSGNVIKPLQHQSQSQIETDTPKITYGKEVKYEK